MSDWETLPLVNIIKPEPIEEVLMEATARNVRVDGIKMKVWKRTGVVGQALCEVLASLTQLYYGDEHCI